MTDSSTSTYTVQGMTCDHCAASVSEEIGELAGVEEVAVDLTSGRLEVRGVRCHRRRGRGGRCGGRLRAHRGEMSA